MGNETATQTRRRNNKNSFSVDFGHELPSKIKPNTNTLKLIPINEPKDRSFVVASQNNDYESADGEEEVDTVKKLDDEGRKESSARLQKLNSTNDELRRELIRISTQLTEKLKKKKFQVKKVEQKELNPNKKESLKKELQNAYKQIDMYKKLLYDLKIGESSGAKLLDVENKISAVDLEIEKTMTQMQAIKNVTSNQSAGIRKDKGWEALEELKSQVEALKLSLKQKSKQERLKQKKYMQQHHYMKALQQKLKELEQEEEKAQKEAKETDRPSEKDKQAAEEELQQLKIKHDQYHKRINAYLVNNKVLKEQKRELKLKLEEKVKVIEGLKYKRDAFVKQIKDNLHLFATRSEQKSEELSQFESEQEEEPDPIQEEEDERGTFDVQHLKDHQLKQISKEEIMKKKQQRESIKEEANKAEPKLWKRQLTRIISKGKQSPDEKHFSTGLTLTPKLEIKIIQMNVWMNKKKQITAIQPSYMVDGRILDGSKSSKNAEDEYRVTFELDEHDFLKSVLGIFGKSGFLQYLVLQSNFGKVSKIGREQTDGDNFAVGVAKEETPVQITGANRQDGIYWRISRLDFEVLIETGN